MNSDAANWTPVTATGEADRAVHEYVIATDREGERHLACAKCGHSYGPYDRSYKYGAAYDEREVMFIPSQQDPSQYVDDKMVFRRFCCPQCLTQIATEIVRAEEPVFPEMQLTAPSATP